MVGIMLDNMGLIKYGFCLLETYSLTRNKCSNSYHIKQHILYVVCS